MSTITTTSTPNAAEAEKRPARIKYITPAVSIYEDSDGYTLELELPGASKESVNVEVTNGELIITGTKDPRPEGERIYGESTRADYRRVFDLDPAVKISEITAKMEQGLLAVRLPKTPESKPHRINITG